MSKLLSILLIATLVFTSASVAFAGTEKEQAVNDTAAVAASIQATEIGEKVAQVKTVQIRKELNLFTISKESDFSQFNTGANDGEIIYSTEDKVGNNYGYAKKISLPAKGVVYMTGRAMLDSASPVWFGLYKDPELKNKVDTSGQGHTSPNDTSARTITIQVPDKGTYYLGVYSSSSFLGLTGVTVAAGYARGDGQTVTSKKEILVGQKNAQSSYFKFKAPSAGYFSVAEAADEYDKVTLCNSKKKAISNSVYAKYATFGVKKGTTYYIKVETDYNSGAYYKFQINHTKVKEKSGAKKAKAVTLKKNKKAKGTITAGSKQEDWYKIKLTKKTTKIRVYISGDTSGQLMAKLCNSKGKAVSNLAAYVSYDGDAKYFERTGKIDKGTYYIKVYNPNKKYSGYYTLSWK